MVSVFLSVGSNKGDRLFFLKKSVEEIAKNIGDVSAVSGIYESQSWGFEGQNFLNMALKVESFLPAAIIMSEIRKIETELGRERVPGEYTDRTIDIDILFYEDEVISAEGIEIPHPRLHERLFVLEPMMDLAPEYKHPVLNKTIRQLRQECTDNGWIKVFD